MEKTVEEKVLNPKSGAGILVLSILGIIASIVVFILGIRLAVPDKATHMEIALGIVMIIGSVLLLFVFILLLAGLKIVEPKEAVVFTLFGKYYGTIKSEGFFFVNPFCSEVNPVAKPSAVKLEIDTKNVTGTVGAATSKKISLKTMTLNNDKQKVNDVLGNPIIVGAVVIWKVKDPTKAVFNVENYRNFLSIQCDSTIRNTARMYPYDSSEEDVDEKSLRGSSQAVAEQMQKELQRRVDPAGLEILEVRITHLSYAEEIAASMLQRQQAVAVIAARKKIVEGAVGMVNMAIEQLSEQNVVELDEERKAQMVSNLMVVLCGNKDAQPIVNSGSIY